MKGLVIINGYPNGEKFLRQGERIAAELCALGIQTDVLRNGEVVAFLTGDGRAKNNLTKDYAFAVYLDKDKYLGKMLEACGLRLFNSATSVEICDDKMLTYLALQGVGVPIVESIPAPLCYTPKSKPNDAFLNEVAELLGFPLVAKKSYGSFGKGVQLVHGIEELRETEENWLYTPHFYQRYICESAGRDVRVMVIGGKAVAAMERVAQKGEFRSNVELGGVGREIILSKEYVEVAEKAAAALHLDYCGVDILESKNGPVVCEVNSNAFFEGLEKVTKINVARLYAEYIFDIFHGKN